MTRRTKRHASPEDAAKIADHARGYITCRNCGAMPGFACVEQTAPGQTVCSVRFGDAAIELKAELKAQRRTPEQDAILASLPRIPREEIEKCRTPKGGYRFSRAWFLEHGLPWPPIAGWRQAVERDEP